MKIRLYIGFITAIVLVIIVGLNSYRTFQKENEETNRVRHTYRMLNQMQEVQSVLIDMEVGMRGFRSTNEKRFLERYKNGLPLIHPAINELDRLATNPEVRGLIRKLEYDIEQVLQFWSAIGEDASNFSRKYSTELMDKEKYLIGIVRKQINAITEIEQNTLVKAETANAKTVEFATINLVISICLILAIVLVLIMFILKEFNTRTKTEQALQINNQHLTKANYDTSEKNWLLAGVAQVNNSLHGDTDPTTLSQGILNTLIEYLEIEAGAFYIYNPESNELFLSASYALPFSAKTSYLLKEGLVGQAAVNKNSLCVKNIPAQYLTLQTSALNAQPAEALYFPIYFNDEIKGIIELLTLGTFQLKHHDFFKVISDNVAVAINSAQNREKVFKLLNQVQEQKEVLEQQQEELRQANEELSHQTETLQHSEEELKVQEEELRQINAELEEKNEAVETARQAVELKASELEITGKYKSEFLANMSHELRTPLNSVLILAKLLAENKSENLTEKQVSHANIIYKSGADLLNLINDILDLSKIEAGKIDLHFEEIPVGNIANDIEQLFRAVAEEKEIAFDVKLDTNKAAYVHTDRQRIEQVIKNLLSNAFKFTPVKGRVTLRFSIADKSGLPFLQVTVADNGIGISPAKQQAIFEAFQQADGSTSRKYGGTGLGLSITKELVKILGGYIQLASEEGKGSIFTIGVPLHLPEKNATRVPRKFDNPLEREKMAIVDDRFDINAADKTLLVIEDDVHFSKLVRDYAIKKGFKAILATNGEEGLEMARKFKPGAIILDLHLPDANGETILNTIKNDEVTCDIPVHIISAFDTRDILPGAIAYLQKPVSKKDLDNVFLLLGESMKIEIKKVLLITGENLQTNVLKELINSRRLDVHADFVSTVDEAIEKTKETSYDCVIADIGKNVDTGIAKLEALSLHLQHKIPVIIYLDEDITPGNDLQLKKISDVVVRTSSTSKERLMDELELFLYKVQEEKKRPEKILTSGTNSNPLKGKKVLLADDDMRNLFALTAALESEQLEVITAVDGKEAVAALERQPEIDIVLMDIMMPNMDGYQAMNHIRNQMGLKELPIIALTAKAMSDDKEKCIAAGASDYISKPVEMQKLKSLIRVWLS